MQIEIARTAADLERLGPEWKELVAASAVDNPFLQWEWCSTWWRHYGAGHELAVLVARDAGEIVGLAPLYIERGYRRLGCGTMQFLGTGEVHSEYLSLVLRRGHEATATRSMMEFLLHSSAPRWRLLRLTDMPVDDLVAPAIQSQLADSGNLFRAEPSGGCWYIELADSWEEFLRGVSRNRKEKFRRARRDMEKNSLEFHEVTNESELDAACLRRIARYKRPREYRFVPALPKNSYGKVLKKELRATFEQV